MLVLILVIVLVIALLGGLPQTNWADHSLGYGPSSVLGVVLVVLLILLLLGRI